MLFKSELVKKFYMDFEINNLDLLYKIEFEFLKEFGTGVKELNIVIKMDEYKDNIEKLKSFLRYKGYSCNICVGQKLCQDVIFLKIEM